MVLCRIAWILTNTEGLLKLFRFPYSMHKLNAIKVYHLAWSLVPCKMKELKDKLGMALKTTAQHQQGAWRRQVTRTQWSGLPGGIWTHRLSTENKSNGRDSDTDMDVVWVRERVTNILALPLHPPSDRLSVLLIG